MLSLPDWAFYPLAAMIIGGMVVTAVSFGENHQRSPEEIRAEGIVYEGEALAALIVGNGLTVEFLQENGTRFARIMAARGPLDGIQSAGAFFTLSPDERSAIDGHRVRVQFVAKAAPEAAAAEVRANLFIPGRTQSHWETFSLTDDHQVFTLDITPRDCTNSYAYAGLWPDWTNGANTVDLQLVEITILEPISC